jgi:peptide deformylase
MILPIVAYGSPVLRKVCEDIPAGYEGLDRLLADMWETMYHSNGVGLAAPQINRAIRLFVVDSAQIFAHQEESEKGVYSDEPGYKGVFINAHIKALEGEEWAYNEGCLSIPRIREDIYRQASVTLDFLDEQMRPHTQTFTGLTARIILHEYDHIDGKLFIDYLKPLKKKLLKGKLDDITKGKVKTDYRMVYVK